MSIITRNDSLDYFRSFKVTVEYVELSQRHDKNYFPPNPQTCYKYPDKPPERTSISVICDRPLVGNQVTIRLENKNTQLVICDFRVFAGRNLAQHRKVMLSSTENGSAATVAVDGQNDTHNWEACSTTKSQQSPSLSIDLGYRGEVRSLALEKLDDENLTSYAVWTIDDNRNWQKLHEDRNVNQVKTVIGTSVIAQQLQIVGYTFGRLSVCEVQIFGDCPNNVCGLECNKICHCRNINLEDKASGICSAGCEDRWTGINGSCDKECRHNTWGEGCQHRCGHCLSSESCVASTGICPSGCSPGYQPPYCNVDINECLDYRNICYENATCTNIDGSYKCSCNAGYQGDGKTCADINECLEYRNICHEHATCSNTDGSYRCSCNAGYKGHGLTCTDINECLEYRNICHENATCTNIDGSYRCSCNSGYQGDGKTCADINECSVFRNICHVHATCTNIDGSYRCSCNAGYRGHGQTCTDVNECSSYPRACHVHASCTNTEGSYNCTCNAGYKGNGRECTDCPDGTFGENCVGMCGACNIISNCQRETGECSNGCLPGWLGRNCTLPCKDGFYGQSCYLECGHCKNGNPCDTQTGHCQLCEAGYTGEFCRSICSAGRYGEGCQHTCGNCAGSEPCNRTTGACLHGCSGHFSGSHCNEETSNSPTIGYITGMVVCVAAIVVATFIIGILVYNRREPTAIADSIYTVPSVEPARSDNDTYDNLTSVSDDKMEEPDYASTVL